MRFMRFKEKEKLNVQKQQVIPFQKVIEAKHYVNG